MTDFVEDKHGNLYRLGEVKFVERIAEPNGLYVWRCYKKGGGTFNVVDNGSTPFNEPRVKEPETLIPAPPGMKIVTACAKKLHVDGVLVAYGVRRHEVTLWGLNGIQQDAVGVMLADGTIELQSHGPFATLDEATAWLADWPELNA